MVGTGVPNPILRRTGRRTLRTGWALLTTAALAALGLAAGPAAPAAHAAPTSGSYVYYIGADGGLWGWAMDGPDTAVRVGPAGIAPPGGHVAVARVAGGPPSVFFAGADGALYEACPAAQQPVAVTKAGFAAPGAVVTAAVVAGQYAVAADGIPMPVPAIARQRPAGAQEISNPCLPPAQVLSNTSPSYVPGGAMASAGASDGSWALFYVDGSGAVRAQWRSPNGGLSDKEMTAPNSAAPGSGLAVTQSPSGLELFYAGNDGRLYTARPATGGGLADSPRPNQTGDADVPAGAQLAAASLPSGSSVAYANAKGIFVAAELDAGNNWQHTDALSKAGFVTAGSSVAVVATPAGDDEDICPTPWYLRHLHWPGPGPWPGPPWETIQPATVAANTSIAGF
jgi:hypothetical protein